MQGSFPSSPVLLSTSSSVPSKQGLGSDPRTIRLMLFPPPLDLLKELLPLTVLLITSQPTAIAWPFG